MENCFGLVIIVDLLFTVFCTNFNLVKVDSLIASTMQLLTNTLVGSGQTKWQVDTRFHLALTCNSI